MRLKSYFATSVEAALQRARTELGGDAMLLDSRPAHPEARHLGAYEVVFALAESEPEPPRQSSRTAAEPAAPGAATPAAPQGQLQQDLQQLRRELQRLTQTVSRSGSISLGTSRVLADPSVSPVYAEMMAGDCLPDVAQEVLGACLGSAPEKGLRTSALRQRVREELARRVPVAPELGRQSPRARTAGKRIAVAGPAGSGKTTALVKMALDYGVRSRKPVQILSLDTMRIGAAEQLRGYCSVLGVGFSLLESFEELPAALEEYRQKHWIFVDTPGMGWREQDLIAPLGAVLQRCPDLDVHLVLPATTRSADLRDQVARWAPAEPDKLLFTHVDETGALAGAVSVAIATRVPVSFLSTGQRVPEDFEPASAERLVTMALPIDTGRAAIIPRADTQAGSAAAGR